MKMGCIRYIFLVIFIVKPDSGFYSKTMQSMELLSALRRKE